MQGDTVAVGILECDVVDLDGAVQPDGHGFRLDRIDRRGFKFEEGEEIVQKEKIPVDFAHAGEEALHQLLAL